MKRFLLIFALVASAASADVNLLSFAQERPLGVQVVGDLIPLRGMSDTLKVSGSADGEIHAGLVRGGREDCFDANNRAARIKVYADLWQPRGKYIATVKGGSEDIELHGLVDGHGSEVDIDLGNYSEQSDERTRRVVLNLRTKDGSPITYRVLNAEPPILLNAHEQRYEQILKLRGFWGDLFAVLFGWLKQLGIASVGLPRPEDGGPVRLQLLDRISPGIVFLHENLFRARKEVAVRNRPLRIRANELNESLINRLPKIVEVRRRLKVVSGTELNLDGKEPLHHHLRVSGSVLGEPVLIEQGTKRSEGMRPSLPEINQLEGNQIYIRGNQSSGDQGQKHGAFEFRSALRASQA